MSSLLGTTADWYLMRASGFVALALLTITVGLGVANVARLTRSTWARSVASLVHRNASLLAVLFVAIHVLTAISDRYVKVPALAILIPGLSHYDPFWVGLGAVSIDVLIAVVATSLIRTRLRPGVWRAVHWMAYLCWPAALVHALGSGSGSGADTGRAWSTLIYLACGVSFALAAAGRMVLGRRPRSIDPVVRARPRPPAQPLAGSRRP